MLSHCLLDFSVGVGDFVIGLSQISSFLSCHVMFPGNKLIVLTVSSRFVWFALLFVGPLNVVASGGFSYDGGCSSHPFEGTNVPNLHRLRPMEVITPCGTVPAPPWQAAERSVLSVSQRHRVAFPMPCRKELFGGSKQKWSPRWGNRYAVYRHCAGPSRP